MEENSQRNVLLAILLSVIVMVGWQYFYAGPKLEQEQQRRERQAELARQAEAEAQQQGGATATGTQSTAPSPDGTGVSTGSVPSTAPVAGTLPRDQVLKQSPRVGIDTPRVTGSISLKGARIDDIVLSDYKQTLKKDSPNVVLLSPSGAPSAFYAEFGWAPIAAGAAKVPDGNTLWTQEGSGVLTPASPVTLVYDNGEGLVFRRTISVDDAYMFTVRDEVENKGVQAVTLHPWALISRHGPQHVVQLPVHEGLIGVLGEHKLQEYTYSEIESDGVVNFQARGGWLGITDIYWAATLVPDQAVDYTAGFKHFATPQSYQTDLLLGPVAVAPGGKIANQTMLFAGAKRAEIIDDYQERLGILQFQTLIDWGWFFYITRPLFYLIEWIYKAVGNFGVAILILTLLVKIAFFPLANKSYVSMAKMKKLQPEMMKIQERFKDDKVKQQQALMELYKKEKVNPMSGCLPILVQIPVFFALYKVLIVAIEMRHAPFFGWIQDLSAPDPTNIFNLFGLLPFTVPDYIPLLHLGVWPIVMGITMWLQMKLNPPPPDPIQARMFAWMPVIFTFLLGSFAAGLVIYWTWNNLLSIAQQYFIMTRQGAKIELMDNLKRDLAWIPKLFGKPAGSGTKKL